MSKFLSVIVPCYREHEIIIETITNLKQTTHDAQIIIVDSSPDDVVIDLIHSKYSDDPEVTVIKAVGSGKRGPNMNEGAEIAAGEVLLFHHADSKLPDDAYSLLCSIDWKKTPYGGFVRSLQPAVSATRLTDWIGHRLVDRYGFFLGDNSIFITKEYFDTLGGYRERPLFEDVDLMRRSKQGLRKGQTWKVINDRVVSSSRKFITYGPGKMFFLMLRMEIQYFMGMSVEKIEEEYRKYSQD